MNTEENRDPWERKRKGTPGTAGYIHDGEPVRVMEDRVAKAGDALKKLREEMEKLFDERFDKEIRPMLEEINRTGQFYYPGMIGFDQAMGHAMVIGKGKSFTTEWGEEYESDHDDIQYDNFFKSLLYLINDMGWTSNLLTPRINIGDCWTKDGTYAKQSKDDPR